MEWSEDPYPQYVRCHIRSGSDLQLSRELRGLHKWESGRGPEVSMRSSLRSPRTNLLQTVQASAEAEKLHGLSLLLCCASCIQFKIGHRNVLAEMLSCQKFGNGLCAEVGHLRAAPAAWVLRGAPNPRVALPLRVLIGLRFEKSHRHPSSTRNLESQGLRYCLCCRKRVPSTQKRCSPRGQWRVVLLQLIPVSRGGQMSVGRMLGSHFFVASTNKVSA